MNGYTPARERAWSRYDARWKRKRHVRARRAGFAHDAVLLFRPAVMTHYASTQFNAGYDAGYRHGVTARRDRRRRALVTALVIGLAAWRAW